MCDPLRDCSPRSISNPIFFFYLIKSTALVFFVRVFCSCSWHLVVPIGCLEGMGVPYWQPSTYQRRWSQQALFYSCRPSLPRRKPSPRVGSLSFFSSLLLCDVPRFLSVNPNTFSSEREQLPFCLSPHRVVCSQQKQDPL